VTAGGNDLGRSWGSSRAKESSVISTSTSLYGIEADARVGGKVSLGKEDTRVRARGRRESTSR
jgi:hypothetical protein